VGEVVDFEEVGFGGRGSDPVYAMMQDEGGRPLTTATLNAKIREIISDLNLRIP